MEASCLLKIPSDAEWQYEPKYNPKGESLNRYFRVVGPYYRSSKRIDMLDREIVISAEIFSFGDLLRRITGCIGDDFCLTAADR
jgi:hypothetical protein